MLEQEITKRIAIKELRVSNDHLKDQTRRLEEEVFERRKAEDEIQKLVQDLKIHQAELQAQAEELRITQQSPEITGQIPGPLRLCPCWLPHIGKGRRYS